MLNEVKHRIVQRGNVLLPALQADSSPDKQHRDQNDTKFIKDSFHAHTKHASRYITDSRQGYSRQKISGARYKKEMHQRRCAHSYDRCLLLSVRRDRGERPADE